MSTLKLSFLLYLLWCYLEVISGECYVRVNQLGFLANSTKTAIVLCSDNLASSTVFLVLNTRNQTAAKGTVGTKLSHQWSTTYPNAYSIDFSSVSTTGIYSINVQTSPQVYSYHFQIDSSPKNIYYPLLKNSVFFYHAQRDGHDQVSGVLSRKPSHLTDDSATVYKTPTYKNDQLQGTLEKVGGPVNVSGGWFDAGDYIKFVETTSYVVAVQLLAVRDHPSLFTAGGEADFYNEALYGLNWLSKMWDDQKRVLYYQVGIGDGNSKITGDHDLWRLPEADDKLNVKTGDDDYFIKYRPVFAVGDGASGSPISPNLAGRMSAAFALGYQVYKNSALLSYAEHIWAQKDENPKKLQTTAPFDYYPEDEWRDDLELGATELYFATKTAEKDGIRTERSAEDYLSEAGSWAKQYISKTQDPDTINLYNVAGIAHYELWRALNETGSAVISKSDLINDMKSQLNTGVGNYQKDIFGYSQQYSSGGDLVPHAVGYALQANLLSEIDPASAKTYSAFEQAQVSWLFGNNAWGTSFMIGVGQSFSFCPQHQVANLAGSLNGAAPVLLGAVYDGPSDTNNFSDLGVPDGAKKCPPDGSDVFKKFTGQGVRYNDNVASWPSVEPAQDYSALPVLLFARYIGKN